MRLRQERGDVVGRRAVDHQVGVFETVVNGLWINKVIFDGEDAGGRRDFAKPLRKFASLSEPDARRREDMSSEVPCFENFTVDEL